MQCLKLPLVRISYRRFCLPSTGSVLDDETRHRSELPALASDQRGDYRTRNGRDVGHQGRRIQRPGIRRRVSHETP